MKGKFIEEIRLLLTTFSGEDGYVLKKSPNSLKINFAVIGFFVLLIFIGCFISATTFTYSLFDNNAFISTPFGVFWASIITIIYLLLLYTISPPTMSSKYKVGNKDVIVTANISSSFFTVSMILRLSFMTLLAIIIAQPLNVYFLSKTIEPSLEKYKQLELANMAINADSLFIQYEIKASETFNKTISLKLTNTELDEVNLKMVGINNKVILDSIFISEAYKKLDSIAKYSHKTLFVNRDKKHDLFVSELDGLLTKELESDRNYQDNLEILNAPNRRVNKEFSEYKNQLDKIISDKIKNYESLENLISKSNFYVQKINLLLTENFFSWIITTVVIIIFLLPIRLKYLVRNKGFYNKKTEIEERLVKEAYNDFRIKFSNILENKINEVNTEILKRLEINLIPLKKINPKKYNSILKEVENELKSEKISFYENWENPPFRTIRLSDSTRFKTEKDFLELLYKNNEQ